MKLRVLHDPRVGIAAFTLIELLVVIAILGVLIGLTMPLLGNVRARGENTQCVSNLRQIGAAMAGFAADHDGTLPGPLAANQYPTYQSSDPTSLGTALATYLALPAPTAAPQKAAVLTCPTYARIYPSLNVADFACQQIAQSAGAQWPFGVVGDPSQPPMKIAALTSMADYAGNPLILANIFGLREAFNTINPGQPVAIPLHIDHLNVLFLDWHAGPINSGTMQPK